MKSDTQSLTEISREAVAILARELGVARTVRFLSQFRSQGGDYTAERRAFLGTVSLEELMEEVDAIERGEAR